MRDGVFLPARVRADRGCDEQLLAAIRVGGREREQRLEPSGGAGGAAGEEVVGARASVDLKRPVASGAGGELDQPVRLGVQQSDVQRPVPFGGQLAAEHSPVGEPDPAAQPTRRPRAFAGDAIQRAPGRLAAAGGLGW